MHDRPPDLATDRLRLRAHRRDDLPALTALWSDPDVVRYIGGRPATAQEAWFRLLRYRGLWPLLGFGYWAITRAGDGQYLGDIGLALFRRGIGDAFDSVPEMGWALDPQAAGQGLATEAGRAVLAWADRDLPDPATVCMIDPGNAASIRVAARLGFRPMPAAEAPPAAPPAAAAAAGTLLFRRPRP